MHDDAAINPADEHFYKSLLSLAKSWSKDLVQAAAELARQVNSLTGTFEVCICILRSPHSLGMFSIV